MNVPPESATVTRKVFLSYARGDDEPFVKRLYEDLTKAGFDVWWDRVSMPSRQLTFHQEIADAIREHERLIFVAGPKAGISDYVRQEWRWALELDKPVIPILRLGNYDVVPGELRLLHCEDFREGTPYSEQLAKLVENLKRPEPPLGKLYAVPALPNHFMGREDLLRRLKDAVLVDLQRPVVVTGGGSRVGLQGMGGIGKSVLAAAVARNREVRRAYPDGVIWISFGQKPNLLQLQHDLARHLGSNEFFDSTTQGEGVLKQLLLEKAVFLVLDDVWEARHVSVFDVLGPRCRALVTTRDAGIINTLKGVLYPVELFTPEEALRLLADSVEVEPSTLPIEAREIVRECGCLPLAVALCGGMARAGHSWRDILQALKEEDLEWIGDDHAINEQHVSIWKAMKVSFDALSENDQKRFVELAVFPTDQTVPEAAVQTLWEHTGGLRQRDSTKLLIQLAERSLIRLDKSAAQPGQEAERRVSLHDLLFDLASKLAGDPELLHKKLLDAYSKKCTDGWASGPNDGYFLQNLCHHLVRLEAWSEAESVVTNFSWLMKKSEIGLLDSISGDYRLLDESAPVEVRKRLEIWAAFFREKMHMLRRGNEEWPSHKILLQLAIEHADDSPLTLTAEQWLTDGKCNWFWLRRVPRLPHVQINPCIAVLEGHTDGVHGALELSDGRILSWSGDKTLRLWDSYSGACLKKLEGHTGNINGSLELYDGRLLSWSDDKTLQLWDSHNGTNIAVLDGHAWVVNGALELSDRRLLSWSWDKTLMLWDSNSGVCMAVLSGHTENVIGVIEFSDGYLLSWSEDRTLRLWDYHSGICIAIPRVVPCS